MVTSHSMWWTTNMSAGEYLWPFSSISIPFILRLQSWRNSFISHDFDHLQPLQLLNKNNDDEYRKISNTHSPNVMNFTEGGEYLFPKRLIPVQVAIQMLRFELVPVPPPVPLDRFMIPPPWFANHVQQDLTLSVVGSKWHISIHLPLKGMVLPSTHNQFHRQDFKTITAMGGESNLQEFLKLNQVHRMEQLVSHWWPWTFGLWRKETLDSHISMFIPQKQNQLSCSRFTTRITKKSLSPNLLTLIFPKLIHSTSSFLIKRDTLLADGHHLMFHFNLDSIPSFGEV